MNKKTLSEILENNAGLRIIENLKFRNYVLALSHSNYMVSLGGTEKFMHGEQTELAKHNISYIQIYPYNSRDGHEEDYLSQPVRVNVDSAQAGSFTIIQLGLILQGLNTKRAANPVALHIHHLMNLSFPGAEHLIKTVQAGKVRVFIHDYYTICPQLNLMRNGKEFCGGPPANCEECEWGKKRPLHFSMAKKLFDSVKPEFVAPSRIAADIWTRYFHEHSDSTQVIPHQVRQPFHGDRRYPDYIADPSYRLKIAYMGYKSASKGIDTWWRAASDRQIRKQYDLFHLGMSYICPESVTHVPVSFLNKGPDAMVDALRQYQTDIVVMWSLWPETYSFALDEAFAANCFVVTSRFSGNIADQVRGTCKGVVFDDERQMLDFFYNVAGVREAVRLNLQENTPFSLKFNPELANETADSLNMHENQCHDKERRNVFHNLTRWHEEYLSNFKDQISSLENEKIKTHNVYESVIEQLENEKTEIHQGYKAEIAGLKKREADEKAEYENIIQRLENEKAEIRHKYEHMIKQLENEKAEIHHKYDNMTKQLGNEKAEIHHKYENMTEQLENEKVEICQRYEEEILRAEEEKSEIHRTYKEELARIEQDLAQKQETALLFARELNEIKGSVAWRVIMICRRQADRFLPLNTRRRRFCNLCLMAPFVLFKEGPGSFFRKIFKRLPFGKSLWNIRNPGPGTRDIRFTWHPLTFPEFERVKVSIIIPVFNQAYYTFRCLQSVLEHTVVPFEVIVTDNASQDETPEMLDAIKGIKVIHNQENLGFVSACNKGAELGSGDYCLFLNNDTEVTSGWLESMLRPFEDKKVGVVGARLIYPDGRLQEAGAIIWQDGTGWNYGRGHDPDLPEYSYLREVDYCSGACLLTRRDIWLELGGFDQRYAPAYYEDTDFCFAARDRGYKVIYQPGARVIHHEGISAGTDLNSGYKRYQQTNHVRFREKWHHVLKNEHMTGPEQLYPARERGYSKIVLVADHIVPCFDMDAGSLRMFNIIKIMNDLDYKVVFWPENRAYNERYTRKLQSMGIETMYGDINFEEYLKHNGRHIDLIFLSRPHVGASFIYAAKKLTHARIIYDTVDLHFLRADRKANIGAGNTEAGKTSEEWKRTELFLANESDVTLVVSPVEKEILEKQGIKGRISVIPTIYSSEPYCNFFDKRAGLMFIGGFLHSPNEDGIVWFAESVLPLISRNLPEVRLCIVGSNPTRRVKSLASENISVTGYVEDVSPYFQKARVFVSPLRYGAGVKGKIGQSMSFGLPLVTTSVGAEGIATDGYNALVADSEEAFAEKVTELYQDQVLWESLSLNGRKTVEENFSFDVMKEKLKRVLEKENN